MRKKSASGRLTILILLSILIVSPVGAPLRRGLSTFLEPISTIMYRIGVASSPFNTADTIEGGDESAKLLSLQDENNELRESLNLSSRADYSVVAAEVIGGSSDPLVRMRKINIGSSQNVEEGMAVVAKGYFIGKVVRVGMESSDIQLISDPQFRLTARVEDGEPSIMVGALGGISLDKIPISEDLGQGDVIFTDDLGGRVPSGIPIGTIGSVENESSVFYRVNVLLPIRVETVRFVEVILR